MNEKKKAGRPRKKQIEGIEPAIIKQIPINQQSPITQLQPETQQKKKKLSNEEYQQLAPIEKFKYKISLYEKSSLPELLKSHNIEVSQFKQIVISEVKKNSKLLQAFLVNPASMFASILAGAEIGLTPSELLGEFFLIPRSIRQDDGNYKLTVTPLIGYKGIIKILQRSKDIIRIHTEVVYEGELFEATFGLEPNIIHKPDYTLPRTADKITHVYAVAKMKSDEYQFAIMSREQILAVKAMSKYDNDLYFNDKSNPNRWMEKKTALIQLAKLLPKDYYGSKATELDGMLNAGATLTVDEDNSVKIIEPKKLNRKGGGSMYNSISNSLEMLQEQDKANSQKGTD